MIALTFLNILKEFTNMVSIEKIAEEANVSLMTVSRTLNPRYVDKVKAATRERILEICKKYDYSPKYSARSLASGKTFTVGLVMNDFASGLTSPTMSIVIDAVIKELEKHSYSLNMIHCPGDTLEEMNEKLLNIVFSKRVDGFLFLSEMLTDNSVEKLRKTNIPGIILCMPSSRTLQDNISYVYIDNNPAIYDTVDHLKKIGVKKVAYINAVNLRNYCVDRAESFRRELLNAGIKFEQVNYDYKYKHLKAISDSFDWTLKNWQELQMHDAYIFSNDLMAIGGLKAIELKGLVAGRDKAVVGFDNMEENINYMSSNPVMTTIAPPLCDLGKECAGLLIRKINSSELRSIRLALPSKLIIRSSTMFNK